MGIYPPNSHLVLVEGPEAGAGLGVELPFDNAVDNGAQLYLGGVEHMSF